MAGVLKKEPIECKKIMAYVPDNIPIYMRI